MFCNYNNKQIFIDQNGLVFFVFKKIFLLPHSYNGLNRKIDRSRSDFFFKQFFTKF
jgi:hypothetical protein